MGFIFKTFLLVILLLCVGLVINTNLNYSKDLSEGKQLCEDIEDGEYVHPKMFLPRACLILEGDNLKRYDMIKFKGEWRLIE